LSATNNPVLNQFDFGGFSALAFYWMHNDCNLSDDWCNGCDLDLSGEVNYVDLNIFCSYWLSDKNPVGHWAMDDNAANTTVIDSSINENDGTFIDSTNPNTNAHSVTGQVNRALSFDGVDDYVNIADDPNLDMTTKLTVVLWMKQAASASNKAFVVKWDYKTQGCWAFQTDNSEADEIKVFTATFLEDGGLGGHGKTTNANLAAGNWYHVAFVYDGDGAVNADRLKIYVDSIEKPLAFVGTIPSILQNSTASVKIGKFGGTLSRYFNGIIDDVRIFERALLQAEIEELYYE
jgi:hypothetical protein